MKTENFKHNTEDNIQCPCCGKGTTSIALAILLEVIRAHFDAPVKVNSAARCVKHNKDEGGAKRSEHLIDEDGYADAADIVVEGVSPTQVYMYVKNLPFANLLGIGKYKTFVHVDTRGYAARW